jgi:hypothetical protein
MEPPDHNYVSYPDGGQKDDFAMEKAIKSMGRRLKLLTVRCMPRRWLMHRVVFTWAIRLQCSKHGAAHGEAFSYAACNTHHSRFELLNAPNTNFLDTSGAVQSNDQHALAMHRHVAVLHLCSSTPDVPMNALAHD